MKVLLIGSGGREHSLALKISESPKLQKLYIAPGNPGTAAIGENIAINDSDIDSLCEFAKDNNIDLTLVGPEAPLALGIVDLFEANDLKIIGPGKIGAQLESSKQWAKDFMKKYSIPTADYGVFTDYEKALAYIKNKNEFPIVIKADGLAAGKGVTVCETLDQAQEALHLSMIEKIFADSGHRVVIEDFLSGEEASILAFTDGEVILPMASAQDHKAVFDKDKGPNTGGMGAYSPAPVVTEEIEKKVYEKIFLPVIRGFKAEGIEYKGIVYAGLMIKDNEPYVIEFNIRFGDPETQVVLPRLENDILEVFEAIAQRNLDQITLKWKKHTAICIVLASGGYPGSYEKGKIITGLDYFIGKTEISVIHAGTKLLDDGNVVTNGGRVLGVIGLNESLEKAIKAAYEGVKHVNFDKVHYRKDIAAKALERINS